MGLFDLRYNARPIVEIQTKLRMYRIVTSNRAPTITLNGAAKETVELSPRCGQPLPVPYRPKRTKKTGLKPGEFGNRDDRANQHAEQRRRDMATRSTLSRLRNRKSDLK